MKILEPEASAPARGGLLLLHGFNTNPPAMDPLGAYLASEGFLVYRPVLAGLDSKGLRKADREAWIPQIESAAKDLKKSVGSLPIYCCGFSFGGTLGVLSYLTSKTDLYSAMVLLAPALSLQPKTRFAKALTPLKSFGLALPSMAPAKYGFSRTVSFSAYDSLFKTIDQVCALDASRLKNISIQVIIRENDELVSTTGLRKWFESRDLTHVKFRTTPRDPGHNFFRPHIILDRTCLGSKGWDWLTSEINCFLLENTPSH